jgi:hypothetical protein
VICAVILHDTSERVNKIGRIRIEEISQQLRMTGPTRTYQTKIAGQWWYAIRRNVAYALFAVLASVYLYLIFPQLYVLMIALTGSYVLIVVREGAWQNNEHLRPTKQGEDSHVKKKIS